MFYYIHIQKLNGKKTLVELAERLYNNGYDDRVEYNAGSSYHDGVTHYIEPHLRFVNEDDALAYILTYGGKILKEPPSYIIAGG
jgi:hypothetical protein